MKRDLKNSDLRLHLCSWIDGRSNRCQYPGSTSRELSSTHEDQTRYFCSAHLECTDPMLGAQIVEHSRAFRPPDLQAEHNAKMRADLEAKGLGKNNHETDHDYAMRMRTVALGFPRLSLMARPTHRWQQQLLDDARSGKPLLPIQRDMLCKAKQITDTDLEEVIWSTQL